MQVAASGAAEPAPEARTGPHARLVTRPESTIPRPRWRARQSEPLMEGTASSTRGTSPGSQTARERRLGLLAGSRAR
jgi:hypothetical protein